MLNVSNTNVTVADDVVAQVTGNGGVFSLGYNVDLNSYGSSNIYTLSGPGGVLGLFNTVGSGGWDKVTGTGGVVDLTRPSIDLLTQSQYKIARNRAMMRKTLQRSLAA